MLTEVDIKNWDALDYDYRAMSKYAKSKGLKSIELTEEEQDMFKFDPPLVYG